MGLLPEQHPEFAQILETQSVDISLLHEMAAFSQEQWTKIERSKQVISGLMEGERKSWGVDNSPLVEYNLDYWFLSPIVQEEQIPKPQPIDKLLKNIIMQKGQAVCIVYGAYRNPLTELQATLNEPGKSTKLVVITVGLQEEGSYYERRSNAEKGHYHVGGSIGVAATFEKLHAKLNQLVADGIIAEPYVDMQISRLLGGWETIPLGNKSMEAFFRNFIDVILTSAYMTDNERQSAKKFRNQWKQISIWVQEQMFITYRKWIAANVLSLANPRAYRIYGEIPVDVRNVFANYFQALEHDEPTRYQDQIENTVIAAQFRTLRETQYVVGHFGITYPSES